MNIMDVLSPHKLPPSPMFQNGYKMKTLTNLLWDSQYIRNAQITQVLKFCYGLYMDNQCNNNHLTQPSPQIVTFVTFITMIFASIYIFCGTNKHIIILCTNNIIKQYMHLLPFFSLISHDQKQNNQHMDNTLPSSMFPCTCFFLYCKCLAHLRQEILCTRGKSLIDNPHSPPSKLPHFNSPHLHIAMTDSL